MGMICGSLQVLYVIGGGGVLVVNVEDGLKHLHSAVHELL